MDGGHRAKSTEYNILHPLLKIVLRYTENRCISEQRLINNETADCIVSIHHVFVSLMVDLGSAANELLRAPGFFEKAAPSTPAATRLGGRTSLQ
jgi:hypothetical protein